MTTEELFLTAAVASLRQNEARIAACTGKLTDEQIWARGGENENAVGNLILHLAGNMRQWIIAGLGGAPDTRERDKEFETSRGLGAAELNSLLRGVVAEAVGVIEKLPHERLLVVHEIQGRRATGLEAILKVVEHFGQHTGQIIYVTKGLTGKDLDLTIPRRR